MPKSIITILSVYATSWLRGPFTRKSSCLLFIVAVFALIPRLDEFDYFPGKYLWAEDGNIFLNEAQQLGTESIFKPYQGYLHFYPRITSVLASYFSLIHRPAILLGGWFLSYILMIYSIARGCRILGYPLLSSAFLIGLVSIQPNYGEVFFNITNSQWMLGTALMLLSLINSDESDHEKWLINFVLAFLVFTGPFAIILLPFSIAKMIWQGKYFPTSRLLIITTGSATQLLILLNSDRFNAEAASQTAWVWVSALIQILLFGANTLLTVVAALCFWLVSLFTLARVIKVRNGLQEVHASILLLGVAIALILTSLYSSKHNPMAIVQLGGGNRYTWIPYALIVFSAIGLSIKYRYSHFAIIVLFTFICFQHGHSVKSPNLQFSSFAKFSELRPVTIPINPQWPEYPGWFIDGIPPKEIAGHKPSEFSLDFSMAGTRGSGFEQSDKFLNLDASGEELVLVFDQAIACGNATDIAIEIHFQNTSEGWTQLFWSENSIFPAANSLRRWYPSGHITAQFAFPVKGKKSHIKFASFEKKGKAEIDKITLYCVFSRP